jgi:hypothetical protein
VGGVKPAGHQLVLPKSTMLSTNSVPLVAPIGASCLLQDKSMDACL